MSETDDTEALLLIPPNLFLVSSSDSESLDIVAKKRRKPIQRDTILLESITDEISSIQLRLENLESASFSEQGSLSDLFLKGIQNKKSISCLVTPEKKYPGDFQKIQHSNTFPRRKKSENFKKYSTRPQSSKYSPDKIYTEKYIFGDNSGAERLSQHNPSINLESRFSISSYDSSLTENCSKTCYSSTDTLNMESDGENVTVSPGKRKDNSMLFEIDTFLDSIKRVENSVDSKNNASWTAPIQIKRNINTGNHIDKETTRLNTAEYLSKFIYLPNIDQGDDKSSSKKTTSGDKCFELEKNSNFEFGFRDVYTNKYDGILESKKTFLGKTDSLDTDSIELSEVTQINENEKTANYLDDMATKAWSMSKSGTGLVKPMMEFDNAIDLSKNRESVPKLNSIDSGHFKKPFMCETHPSENSIAIKNQIINKQSTPSVNESCREFSHKSLPKNLVNPVNNVNQEKVDSSNSTLTSQFILPSLSELWGSNSVSSLKHGPTDFHNFEEERLRREHCESVIQQLQKKHLEQQQRLAVAVQVDAAKEVAIKKLREACGKISQQLTDVEEEFRNKLTKMEMQLNKCLQENEHLKEANKQYEVEISNNLQHIHELKEETKLKLIEKENHSQDLQKDIAKYKDALKDKEERFVEVKESNMLVVNLNKQISDNLTSLQMNFEKEKQEHSKTREALNDMRRNREQLDDEMNLLKSEKNNLRLIITEEKSRNTHLDGQKSKLQLSLDTVNKKLKNMETEFATFKNQSEVETNDLKLGYQKKLETIVLSKVQEFQHHLDSAQALMDDESQNREKNLALQYAKMLQRVEQKHQTMIGILEEKQAEEIKLYRFQLAQCNRTIQQLEENISSYRNRRGQIAAQLHSVMENQWQQALQIITNGAANNQSHMYPGMTDQQASMGYNNKVFDNYQPNANNVLMSNNGYQQPCSQSFFNGFSNTADQNSHQKEKAPSRNLGQNLVPDKFNENAQPDLTEDSLQHYIKLLLQRQPGLTDMPKENHRSETKVSKTITNESPHREIKNPDEFPTKDNPNDLTERKNDKHGGLKPPWK